VAVARRAAIVRVDRHTLRVQTWARLLSRPHTVAWGGGYLWVVSSRGDVLTRVDPRAKGSRVDLDAGHVPVGLALSRGKVFVASYNDQLLRIIDERKLRAAGPPLPVPFNPYAVTARGRHVWVTALGDSTVTRIDLH
jgi:streptogramin lyase